MAKKLIPFSLAEWDKQNRSIECLVCRNGNKLEDAHWFERRISKFKMLIVLDNNSIASTDSAGKFHGNSTDSGYDLFIEIDVPDVIQERFVVVFKNGDIFYALASIEIAKNDLTIIESAKCVCKITTNITTGITTSEIIPL